MGKEATHTCKKIVLGGGTIEVTLRETPKFWVEIKTGRRFKKSNGSSSDYSIFLDLDTLKDTK